MNQSDWREIEEEAAPFMEEIGKVAVEYGSQISGVALYFGLLSYVTANAVWNERDSDDGVRFLHDLMDHLIADARQAKKRGQPGSSDP